MGKDIEAWVERCWTCLQFKKSCQQFPQRSITVLCFLPWQHMVCDFVPSAPKDHSGAAYVLTGSLFESVVDLKHSQARSALARCVFRPG